MAKSRLTTNMTKGKNIKSVIAVLLVCTMLGAMLSGCGGSNGKNAADAVVVGGKNYTEALFTAEVIAQLLEDKTDLTIERKYNLAAAVCFEGVKSGEIDIFPEYTGSGLIHYLEMEPVDTAQETYDIVKREYEAQYNLIWLADWGFNNTYANAVTREFSEQHGITTNSQLAAYAGDLVYGADHGFYDREDGYNNMCATYGFHFKSEYKCDVAMVYQAFAQGQMDVASVYSTDGLLSEYDMVVLEDDLGFFPHYYCASVVRQDTLEAHPEIEGVLNQLSKVATEEDMIRYNYLIDTKKMSLEDAAEEFLKDKGLIG